jgi:hypothetical protein
VLPLISVKKAHLFSMLWIQIDFNADPVLDPDSGFFDDRKLQNFTTENKIKKF